MTQTQWQKLKAKSFDERYYEEHRLAGLDYLAHGDWQQAYGRWLADVLNWREKRVLDVGCACGSIAEGMRQAGIQSLGIDCNNHMIQLGRERFPDVPLSVCDAVNLHLFADSSLDGIHSNQAAEHFRPELVPWILAEWRRVLKPGGLVFAVLDTTELYARQDRRLEEEDPTHLCVRPMAWWQDMLHASGLEDVASEYLLALESHSESFFARYDWDWWLVRKPA